MLIRKRYLALPTEVRKMKEDVAKAIVSAEIAVYGVQGKESGAVSLRGMNWEAGLVLVMIVGIAVL
jgi:outer membrane receptor for ferrienterochelin and colicin